MRRDGNQLRITAQLVDVDSGFHIWSQEYDEPLDNVFRVQDAVARSVARELKVKLLGEDKERIANQEQTNQAANRLYLVARSRQNLRGRDNLIGAKDLYEQIVADHPDFAPAYAGLAESVLLLANNHAYIPKEEAINDARPWIERAIELAPNSANTWRAKGFFEAQRYENTSDNVHFENAERAYAKALELDPRDANVMYWYGILLDDNGVRDQAIQWFERSLDTDPLARVPRYRLGLTYGRQGRIEDARVALEEAINLYPDFDTATNALAALEYNLGNFITAEEIMLRQIGDGSDANVFFNLFSLYQNAGDWDSARNVVIKFGEHQFGFDVEPLLLAVLDRDIDSVFEMAEKLADQEQPNALYTQFSAISNTYSGEFQKSNARIESLFPTLFGDDPTINPQNSYQAMVVAYNLLQLGERERAFELLDAALRAYHEFSPDYVTSGVLYRMAEVEALRGNDDQAIEYLERAYQEGFCCRGRIRSIGWTRAHFLAGSSVTPDSWLLSSV